MSDKSVSVLWQGTIQTALEPFIYDAALTVENLVAERGMSWAEARELV